LRELLGLKRAPEFAQWLEGVQLADRDGRLLPATAEHPLLSMLTPRKHP
jgi:ethanolamine ammonia-lyase large subunit